MLLVDMFGGACPEVRWTRSGAVLWIRCHDEAFLLGFAAWRNIWGPNPKATHLPSHFITSSDFGPKPTMCPRPMSRAERQGDVVGWVLCFRAGGLGRGRGGKTRNDQKDMAIIQARGAEAQGRAEGREGTAGR